MASSCSALSGAKRARSHRRSKLQYGTGPSSLEIPALRVLRYRLAPVDHLLVPLSRQSSPVSYPFFLSSPCTDFDPTDFCHLRRRTNYLICLLQIFGLNDKVVRFSSIHLRPIAEYVMLTEGRSARDLLRKKIAL